ncbi:heterokaryon incompatibility protein-domain-containing protein [Nemania abortiva]|nr:heterokaryon incompatibility protein-domain-containing protein [Nemania abortiva]
MVTNNLRTFKYKRLDLKNSTFRLVRLARGAQDEKVECGLIDATLDKDVMAYEAVSYAWGSSDKTCSIEVDGQAFKVTSNLWKLLRGIRMDDQDRYLWIDAISINQDDDLERGHQVQRMQTIYSHADHVLFYLGEMTLEINFFMNALTDFQRRVSYFPFASSEVRKDLWGTRYPPRYARGLEKRNKIWKRGFRELLDRPWFRRAWILQEVANAGRASLCCGKASIHARIFALSPSLLQVDLDQHSSAVFQLMPKTSARERSRKPQHADLRSILINYGGSEASDPRDKIFALLGLCADEHVSDVVTPDYTCDESMVVRAAIAYILTRDLGLPTKTLIPLKWLSSVNVPSISQFLDALRIFSSDASPECMGKSFMDVFKSQPIDALWSSLREKEIGFAVTPDILDIAFSNPSDAVEKMNFLLQYCKVFDMRFLIHSNFSDPTYNSISYDLAHKLYIITELPDMFNWRKIIYRLISLLSGGYLENTISPVEYKYFVSALKIPRKERDDNCNKQQEEIKEEVVAPKNTRLFQKLARLVMAAIFEISAVTFPLNAELIKFYLYGTSVYPHGTSATITLYFTMFRGRLDVARYLLKNGVEIPIGWLPNPLAWALHCEDPDIIAILREHPESVVGCGGELALHCAVELETIPVIRFLLEQGADANAVGAHGQKASQLAISNGRFSLGDVLKAAENGRLDGFDEIAWLEIERKDVREVINRIYKDWRCSL